MESKTSVGDADSGVPETGNLGRTRSGRVLCLDELDCESFDCGQKACEFLECTERASTETRACLRRCTPEGTCPTDELCIGDSTLEASCFGRCEWPDDCAYGFNCFDYFETGEYACVPGEWARAWLGAH